MSEDTPLLNEIIDNTQAPPVPVGVVASAAVKGIDVDKLDEIQRLAVERCLDIGRRIVAVTGPAGSGKTTIMRVIYDLLVDAGYNPVIVAPTGKAARRVREATGAPARTIHMLLEYSMPREINPRTGLPYGGSFPKRTRENPIEYDCVIGDEYAMVHQELHRNLVDALPRGARLLVFGDVQQLPPIETDERIAKMPSAFMSLLAKFDGIYLKTVHRQTEDSGILFNAQRILDGKAPQRRDDFEMLITEKPVDAVLDQLDKADYKSLRNQILTPGNKSWIGTMKLNATIQTILFPDDRPTIKLPRREYNGKQLYPDLHVGVGDKVIMTKNWYDLECSDGTNGVFNGETGIVTEITDLDEVVIDFEDRICRVPPAVQVVIGNKVIVGYPQRDLFLAYAITTHKAQGSEYQNVTYVINKALYIMLNRKNLYTAVTRAREKVTLISDMKALSLAVTTKEPKVFGSKE